MIKEETIKRYTEFLQFVKEVQIRGGKITNKDCRTFHVAKVRRDLIPNIVNIEVTNALAKKVIEIVNAYTNSKHTIGYLLEMVREIEEEGNIKDIPVEQTLPTELLVQELARRGYKVTLSI